MSISSSPSVAILDAGAQYGKVIDRRVRELAVESILLPMNTPADQLKQYQAIIISGGPESVYGTQAPKYDPELFHLNIPIFGICYGMQLLSHVSGGKVEKKDTREDGVFTVTLDTSSLLFTNMSEQEQVLLTHGDTVDQPGDGFTVIGMSGQLITAIANVEKKQYGVQFHPEVDLTPHGKTVLSNFLFQIAGLKPTYTMIDREQKAIEEIRHKVGDGYALVLVSGGVDSTVSAALVTKALGKDRVFAILIDTGFMRQDETETVNLALKKFGLNLRVIEAKEQFLAGTMQLNGSQTAPLNQVIDPEEKRQIIGNVFIQVAQQALESMNLPLEHIYLVQGTLRPDLIESASTAISKTANKIKTHHNDAPLVRSLREQGRIIEPLADYHKDEVRELGEMLGLPDELVWRQPFPGPGLAVRLLCADKPYYTDDFSKVKQQLSQFSNDTYSLEIMPIRTVGVQGDGRSYNYLVGITGPQNWAELFELAKAIPKQVHKVNRVAYIFGDRISQPVTKITPTRLTEDSLDQLRQADHIVNQVLLKYNLTKVISQVLVISFPVPFDTPGNRSIAIRTIITRDFMTGVAATPGKEMPIDALQEMVSKILAEVPGISRVAYDLTSKPPATTEWE